MTTKSRMLITVALVLAVVYAVFFTDWFKPKTIAISHISRPFLSRAAAARAGTVPVTFGFEREYRLTEIKVVPLAAGQTNQDALPVWHLVSDSKSEPVKFFTYGESLRGMKPALPGTGAEPLQTNVVYRLFVVAGGIKGQHDFQVRPAAGR
jgi:hypothetical protein